MRVTPPRPSRAALSLAAVVGGALSAGLGAGLAWGVGAGLLLLGVLAIALGLLAGWE